MIYKSIIVILYFLRVYVYIDFIMYFLLFGQIPITIDECVYAPSFGMYSLLLFRFVGFQKSFFISIASLNYSTF